MTEAVMTADSDINSVANSALKFAASFWFVIAVIGQWMFASYVAGFYGGSALRGELAVWNKVYERKKPQWPPHP